MLHFFNHFEMVVDEQRHKEAKANAEMGRCMPRLTGNVILLKHASEIGNAIEDQGEESRAHVTRERESSVPDRHKLKSANGRVSNSKRVQNVQVRSPNTLICISSRTSHHHHPPQHPLTSHLKLQQQILLCRVCTVLKLIRWFSVCTSNLIIDQQPNVDMFQQLNFYSKQNDSPSQTQLLQKYIAHLSF